MTTSDPYIKYSDIILVDEERGTEYCAISTFLKCKSKYFEALLSENWNPQENKKFKVKTPSCFEKILKWIYTGKLNVLCKELAEVYEFADMYQMDELISEIVYQLNEWSTLFHGNKNQYLKLDPAKSDFLFQPIFIDFLIKHRAAIAQYYFSQQPIYSFITKIVCCENIHAQTPFINNSHWAIQSASFNCLHIKYGVTILSGLEFHINLLAGIKFRVSSFQFTPIQISLFGVRSNSELVLIDSKTINNGEFFTKFILKPTDTQVDTNDNSPKKIDVVLNKIEIKGDTMWCNDLWNSQ